MFIDFMDRMIRLLFPVVAGMRVPGLFLHSLHVLFFHCVHTVHQPQCLHPGVRHGIQDVLYPDVIFSAYINKYVAVLYGDNILGRRLIRMALLAGFQEHL